MLLTIDGFVGDIKSYGLIDTFDWALIVYNRQLYFTGHFSFDDDSILCVSATGGEPYLIYCHVDSDGYLRVNQ